MSSQVSARNFPRFVLGGVDQNDLALTSRELTIPALTSLAPTGRASSNAIFSTVYFYHFLAGFIGWISNRIYPLVLFKTNSAPPNIKKCIGGLLAAIPLIDGMMLASIHAIMPSLLCLLTFLVIPRLHRWVSGT